MKKCLYALLLISGYLQSAKYIAKEGCHIPYAIYDLTLSINTSNITIPHIATTPSEVTIAFYPFCAIHKSSTVGELIVTPTTGSPIHIPFSQPAFKKILSLFHKKPSQKDLSMIEKVQHPTRLLTLKTFFFPQKKYDAVAIGTVANTFQEIQANANNIQTKFYEKGIYCSTITPQELLKRKATMEDILGRNTIMSREEAEGLDARKSLFDGTARQFLAAIAGNRELYKRAFPTWESCNTVLV